MYQKRQPWHNLRTALAYAAVLVIGSVLRLQPWGGNPTQAAQPATVPSAQSEVPLPESLAVAVLGFYDRVDRGQYAEAYDASFEARWIGLPDGSYQPAGLSSKQEFVDALTKEFGANGLSLRIDAIQILDAAPLPLPGDSSLDSPEYAVLAYLPDDRKLAGLYEVQLAGSLGDSCTPLPWHKRLILADFADGQPRVLLSGGARPGSTHKNEWFTDDDPFASQVSEQEKSN